MTRPLPDHDPFDTLPWRPGTPDVVITEKDAVSCRPSACPTAAAQARRGSGLHR
jgi:hypothetical protein